MRPILVKSDDVTVADPDLELREEPGLDLLALSAIFHSVISSFLTQNKGGGGGAGLPGPSPRSATVSEVEESQTRLITGVYRRSRSQWVKANLAETQPQNHQNVQKRIFGNLLIFVIWENEI